MGGKRGVGALGDAEGLQGGGGFGVGEGHGAELGEAQAEGEEEGQRVEPAFVFEMSMGHGGYCNRLLREGKLLLLSRIKIDKFIPINLSFNTKFTHKFLGKQI